MRYRGIEKSGMGHQQRIVAMGPEEMRILYALLIQASSHPMRTQYTKPLYDRVRSMKQCLSKTLQLIEEEGLMEHEDADLLKYSESRLKQ